MDTTDEGRELKRPNGQPLRVLVTGATGFIGSNLVQFLHDKGCEVQAIARGDVAQTPAIARVYRYTGETQQVMDAVAEVKPDVVFHLASLFLASHNFSQVTDLIASNVLFGCQLLEAMRSAGATALVNAGTAWQHFDGDGYVPTNLYAATKQAFEDLALYYVQTAGLRMVTLRLYDTYGPGDTRRKLIRLLLDCARTGEPLGMSPGEQVIDLGHIDDVCRAFWAAANLVQSETDGSAEVYAISGGDRRSLRGIAALVEQVAGKKLPINFGALPYRAREVMVPWVGAPLPGWKAAGFVRRLHSQHDGVSKVASSATQGEFSWLYPARLILLNCHVRRSK